MVDCWRYARRESHRTAPTQFFRRLHLFLVANLDPGFTFNDVVDLVGTGVAVRFLRLTGFEAVEIAKAIRRVEQD